MQRGAETAWPNALSFPEHSLFHPFTIILHVVGNPDHHVHPPAGPAGLATTSHMRGPQAPPSPLTPRAEPAAGIRHSPAARWRPFSSVHIHAQPHPPSLHVQYMLPLSAQTCAASSCTAALCDALLTHRVAGIAPIWHLTTPTSLPDDTVRHACLLSAVGRLGHLPSPRFRAWK